MQHVKQQIWKEVAEASLARVRPVIEEERRQKEAAARFRALGYAKAWLTVLQSGAWR